MEEPIEERLQPTSPPAATNEPPLHTLAAEEPAKTERPTWETKGLSTATEEDACESDPWEENTLVMPCGPTAAATSSLEEKEGRKTRPPSPETKASEPRKETPSPERCLSPCLDTALEWTVGGPTSPTLLQYPGPSITGALDRDGEGEEAKTLQQSASRLDTGGDAHPPMRPLRYQG